MLKCGTIIEYLSSDKSGDISGQLLSAGLEF